MAERTTTTFEKYPKYQFSMKTVNFCKYRPFRVDLGFDVFVPVERDFSV